MFVLTELMIRTGSSLGTNKVFFCCGSHDVDGHDDDCEDLWGFSPESLRLATLISHQGHLEREEGMLQEVLVCPIDFHHNETNIKRSTFIPTVAELFWQVRYGISCTADVSAMIGS